MRFGNVVELQVSTGASIDFFCLGNIVIIAQLGNTTTQTKIEFTKALVHALRSCQPIGRISLPSIVVFYKKDIIIEVCIMSLEKLRVTYNYCRLQVELLLGSSSSFWSTSEFCTSWVIAAVAEASASVPLIIIGDRIASSAFSLGSHAFWSYFAWMSITFCTSS